MDQSPAQLTAVSFDDVPGWREDNVLAAFQAFCASSAQVAKLNAAEDQLPSISTSALTELAKTACSLAGSIRTDAAARAFFEQHFTPHRFLAVDQPGLLTGYYEPVLQASRQRTDAFQIPVLARPKNLVNLVSDADRGKFGDQLTHVLDGPEGQVPCPDREQIETGAFDGQSLELAWLACPVDAFFLHVEGSGKLVYDDGSEDRISYAGKNGYPYTSVGRVLIDQGIFQKGELTFEALYSWLKADLDRAQPVLWQNKSYIFFRRNRADEPDSALGVGQIPLVPLRSLAVDTTFHQIGTPIFVVAPELKHADQGGGGFARLMIAHDVGSAIRGAERGDIFFGSGSDAGIRAGQTVHKGVFYVLKPKAGASA